MASPPPPYSNITGVARAVMKFNAQEPFASYDGNARPGELVVDTTNYSLYIGNADGGLNAVGNGGGGGGGSNIANGNSNVSIAASGGIVTFGISGNANVASINGLGIMNLSDKIVAPNATFSETVIANVIDAQTVNANGNVVANGNVTANTIIATANIILTGELRGNGASPAPFINAFNSGTFAGNVTANLLIANVTANVGNINIAGNVFMPNISETTTGTSPLLLWDDGGNGRVGYDSTVYYDHTEEQLHVGNVVINDNVTGGTIGLNESDQDLQFTVNSGGTTTEVMRLIGATALLKLFPSSGTPPTSSLGAFYFNNDSGQLSGVGLYFCANTSLGNGGWQLVNLT